MNNTNPFLRVVIDIDTEADEIIAMRDLQHPNLLRYIDCGEQAIDISGHGSVRGRRSRAPSASARPF